MKKVSASCTIVFVLLFMMAGCATNYYWHNSSPAWNQPAKFKESSEYCLRCADLGFTPSTPNYQYINIYGSDGKAYSGTVSDISPGGFIEGYAVGRSLFAPSRQALYDQCMEKLGYSKVRK